MEATPTVNLYDLLAKIQDELKAPKDQYNSFGKYKYRSAEGILESVKPILKKYGCLLWINDDVVAIGERVYVKATVYFMSTSTQQHLLGAITVSAFARESDAKTGMDCSQITGAASSYARKYALNGLFAIDDTKDADALNTSPEYTAPAPKKTLKPDCPEDVWNRLVKAEVQGKKTKEGLSPLQYLAKNYHTDQLVLTQFNQAVQMFRDAMEENSNTKQS